MPRDYLLDNNVISVLADPRNPKYGHVKSKYDTIPAGTQVAFPVIAIAEIECGMAMAVTAAPVQQAAVRKFLAEHPLYYGVGRHTVKPYSLVRAALWRQYGTPKGGKRFVFQEKLPEELKDRASGLWLGIDERDLLIVSIALEYNLTFATMDRNEQMKRIEGAVSQVVSDGTWPEPLHLDDWTPPNSVIPSPAPAVPPIPLPPITPAS